MQSEASNVSLQLGSFIPPAVGNIGSNQSKKLRDIEAQFPNTSIDGRTKGKDAVIPFRPLEATGTSPINSGDDIEKNGLEDEIFALDEDLSKGDAKEGKMNSADDDLTSDNEEQNGDPLTASSSHAGSLPIEIKWPQRLNPIDRTYDGED